MRRGGGYKEKTDNPSGRRILVQLTPEQRIRVPTRPQYEKKKKGDEIFSLKRLTVTSSITLEPYINIKRTRGGLKKHNT